MLSLSDKTKNRFINHNMYTWWVLSQILVLFILYVIPHNLIQNLQKPWIKAFFSTSIINLLLSKLAWDCSRSILAFCLFCMNLAAVSLYCEDLGPIFSQDCFRAWLIRYMYAKTNLAAETKQNWLHGWVFPLITSRSHHSLESYPSINSCLWLTIATCRSRVNWLLGDQWSIILNNYNKTIITFKTHFVLYWQISLQARNLGIVIYSTMHNLDTLLSQNGAPVWTVLVMREPQMSFELDAGYELLSAVFTHKLFISYMLTNVPS